MTTVQDIWDDPVRRAEQSARAMTHIIDITHRGDDLLRKFELYDLGFRCEHTGGFCTAAVAKIGLAYIVLTDDAESPESLDDPVTCGFYPDEDGSWACDDTITFNFETLRECIAWLKVAIPLAH